MTGRASRRGRRGPLLAPVLAVGCVLGALCAGPAPARAADGSGSSQQHAVAPRPVPSTRQFAFDDDQILESSGLVDRGSVVYTTNDSGDDAVVYGVDPSNGRTVSRTAYARSVHDVEDLAPGADGSIWAGDTGDNRHSRESIAVHRLRPADGYHPGTTYPLAYPDGSHDAEALLVNPRTQQVFVVSKSVFGGTVYAAPRRLVADRTNRLTAFARVDGLITDGAFLPGGRRLVLRTYTAASVYTFPGFALVGTVRLPAQPQGEGISVGADGRVLVSSEGLHSEVLRVDLPAALTTGRPTSGSASAEPVPQPRSTPAAPPDRDGPDRGLLEWLAIGAVAAVIAAAGWWSIRDSA